MLTKCLSWKTICHFFLVWNTNTECAVSSHWTWIKVWTEFVRTNKLEWKLKKCKNIWTFLSTTLSLDIIYKEYIVDMYFRHDISNLEIYFEMLRRKFESNHLDLFHFLQRMLSQFGMVAHTTGTAEYSSKKYSYCRQVVFQILVNSNT